jgi:hypothetical protein
MGRPNPGGTVTIEDRGIGMTEEVLRSYFLRVGASFRDSDAWRKAYANNGIPSVIRSGRFGVGVFAAFLLGERIDVCTRHVNAPANEAMAFVASIEDDMIEVKKQFREHIGTTIRVRIDGPTFRRLSEIGGVEWDWYRWNEPVVERRINGQRLSQLTRIPRKTHELDDEWHRLEIPGYDELLWTYGRVPTLVCNGLNIGPKASALGHNHVMRWEGESNITYVDIPLEVPRVAVTDRLACLPIDLQRYGLVKHHYPFASELLAAVTRDFCAYCLTFAPAEPPWCSGQTELNLMQRYPGWAGNYPYLFHLHGWIYGDECVAIPHQATLASYRPEMAVLVIGINGWVPPSVCGADLGRELFLGVADQFRVMQSLPEFVGQMMGHGSVNLGLHPEFYSHHEGAVVFLSEPLADMLYRNVRICADVPALKFSRAVPGIPIAAVCSSGASPDVLKIPPQFVELVSTGRALVALLFRPSVRHALRETAFTREWNRLMADYRIPYEPQARRTRFAAAYQALSPLIEQWERLRATGGRSIAQRFFRNPGERF